MTLPAKRTGVVARKLGMTRVFDDAGTHIPVTVLSLDGCQVVGLRTTEDRTTKVNRGSKKDAVEKTRNDGYTAVILGAGTKKAKRATKAERGQFAKAGVEPKAKVVEFRVQEGDLPEVGAEEGRLLLRQFPARLKLSQSRGPSSRGPSPLQPFSASRCNESHVCRFIPAS